MAVNNLSIEFITKRKENKMPETTFENAKVGDKVWSCVYGWGEIKTIITEMKYPISVKFKRSNYTISYNWNGIRIPTENCTLFWDEINMTPPERPKRKVKKVIQGWESPSFTLPAVYKSHHHQIINQTSPGLIIIKNKIQPPKLLINRHHWPINL